MYVRIQAIGQTKFTVFSHLHFLYIFSSGLWYRAVLCILPIFLSSSLLVLHLLPRRWRQQCLSQVDKQLQNCTLLKTWRLQFHVQFFFSLHKSHSRVLWFCLVFWCCLVDRTSFIWRIVYKMNVYAVHISKFIVISWTITLARI